MLVRRSDHDFPKKVLLSNHQINDEFLFSFCDSNFTLDSLLDDDDDKGNLEK